MSKLGNKSICGKCLHLDYVNGKHCCAAFPPFPPYNGIPEKYTSGEEKHLQVDEGQEGDFVFWDKDPYPKL